MDEQPRKSKRRKTMGDTPSASASSNFHTQTLTQFLANKEETEETWQISDSNDDEEPFTLIKTPKKEKEHGDLKSQGTEGPIDSAVPSLIKSVTPSNRQKKTEIPSSQSPLTPMLMRYSPAAENSPLKSKSGKPAVLSPAIKKLQKTPKNAIIPDSYSTAHSSPTTPTQKSTIQVTPAKRLRFELPEDKENITPGRTKPKTPKQVVKHTGRKPLQEVPDSDEELEETEDEYGDSEEPPETPSRRPKVHTNPMDDAEPPESSYGEFGAETQAELISSHHQPSDELGMEIIPDDIAPSEPEQEASPHVSHAEEDDKPVSSPPSVIERTPASSPQKGGTDRTPTTENVSPTRDMMCTQGVESQRLPLEAIYALGPQTPRSDIMVSLHPEHVSKIVDRTKDHEFRSWKIPPEVSRIWIYITKPVYELRYMCIFGPPKVPGEIQDEAGIGNADFNKGKQVMKYAYEILQVYQLNNPVSLEEMKSKGWVSSAPQKYAFIPPAVVGELTANLRCALFGGDAGDAPLVPSSPHVTVSQELQAQLQSDADYSTQHPPPADVDDDEEVVPSSQTPRKQPRAQPAAVQAEDASPFVKPALPKTHSGSSAAQELPPLLPSQRSQGVRPSQATTVSQSSSPGLSQAKSTPRPAAFNASSQPRHPAGGNCRSSSPAATGRRRQRRRHGPPSSLSPLRSSQFPTRSQMLPDSLVNQEFEEPPPIIWDSADEQSD
ncbi:hypothetical protein F4775DRAFT_586303 [Biscogniauxia sp. FL1348]|nr:hypothetical protein F4775DRAFT_586303 [Biscogniauxia sp. FL1348]